jgi:CBS domain containing-hemolysin-like protein
VRCALPLDRLARNTGRSIRSTPDSTFVAGLLPSQAGRAPVVGARFEIGDLLLEVVEASARRIELVRVTVVNPPA